MYESLASFLKSFSVDFPLLWALLVTVVIASAGLALHWSWELVLRGTAKLYSFRNHGTESSQG